MFVFLHHHEGCKYAFMPKTNTQFWLDKITSNVKRDDRNRQKLSALGWNILTVWECEIRHTHDIKLLINGLSANLFAYSPQKKSDMLYDKLNYEQSMNFDYQRIIKL